MTELKRCPFCGGEAYFTKSVNGSNMIYVGCSPCGIQFKALNVYQPNGEWQPTKDVIAAWNHRSPPPRPIRVLTEHQKAVEEAAGMNLDWGMAAAFDAGRKV